MWVSVILLTREPAARAFHAPCDVPVEIRLLWLCCRWSGASEVTMYSLMESGWISVDLVGWGLTQEKTGTTHSGSRA